MVVLISKKVSSKKNVGKKLLLRQNVWVKLETLDKTQNSYTRSQKELSVLLHPHCLHHI